MSDPYEMFTDHLIELRRVLRHLHVDPDGMELQVEGTRSPYTMLGFFIVPPKCPHCGKPK